MSEIYIKGHYKKNIFQSEAGYVIGLFKVVETNSDLLELYIDHDITFTGYFHELNEVDQYLFYGSIVNHVKYGEQFQVERYERLLPEEKNSIVSFLSSGIFKGIGEKKAEKIESVLGKDTFKVILENPSNLMLIPTITSKNVEELHQKLVEYESSYETIIYLNKIGFNTKDSMKIYNKYKEKTIEVIDHNIYQLISDIFDLYFKKIDIIALKQGIEKDDVIRIDAVILYVLEELSNNLGHTYFYKEELYPYVVKVLKVVIPEDLFLQRLEVLEKDLKIKRLENRYYLMELYEAETLIAKRLTLLNHEADSKCKEIDQMVESLEMFFSITYNEEQKKAIMDAYLKKLLIITGGPGTGKTTIMKAILELYKQINKLDHKKMEEDVALLAPTGRAAKRMSEATYHTASTIHRFLKWNKDNNTFQVNEYNKSNVKFVLIDEASMIDTVLFSNLLKGLHANTKIILVGDYDQLPSVGPGQILHDMISSNQLNVVSLKELYRQGHDSNIITLAYDIKNNSLNKDLFNVNNDLTFIECSSNDVIKEISLLSDTYKDKSYKDIQILAPIYKTYNGIDRINNELKNIFNEKDKTKKEIEIGEVVFRENDKVIQLSNMPDDNVYNGDIGVISKINTKPNKEVYIDFDGNIVKYTPSSFHKFKLAYSISIHKSQGSEFDIVIIPLVLEYRKMLYKKLIYTAITRSKRKLYLVGEYQALVNAVENTSSDIRRTSLKEFLIHGIN